MKLLEHEGKELLQKAGIRIPQGKIFPRGSKIDEPQKFPVMIKPQLISGQRGQRGMIMTANNKSELDNAVKSLTNFPEEFDSILIEEQIQIEKELYLSVTYSTEFQSPVVLFSPQGGVKVEEEQIQISPINISGEKLPDLDYSDSLQDILDNLYACFSENDLFLAEINPLAQLSDGTFMALDAKVITDDAADFRRGINFPPRNLLGQKKTISEIQAETIDQNNHQGVVGRVYLDLGGDIGIIAAGGGASLVAMDALVSFQGKPANYTEFSGNPPSSKVKKLTQIVLNKPNLKGCFLVGGKANFTDQYETLSGFLQGLISLKPIPKYPIVIRRDGPRKEEAFKMLEAAAKKYNLNLTLLDANTPIIEAAQKMVELRNQYAH